MDDRFHARADTLRNKYPGLRPILAKLAGGCLPSPEFLAAIQRSRLPPHQLRQALGLSLGDMRDDTRDPVGRMDQEAFKRQLVFLLNHPQGLLDGFSAEPLREWPAAIWGRWPSGRPRNPGEMVHLIVVQSWGRLKRRKPIFPGCRRLDKETAGLLEEAYQRFILTPKQAKKVIREGMSTTAARFFMCTPSFWLNMRNALFLAVAFLRENDHGGKLQNRIPMAMSDLLGIPRLSLPELRTVADLAGLASVGAIDVGGIPRGRERHRGIGAVLRFAASKGGRRFLDMSAVGADLFGLHIMSKENAQLVESRRTPSTYYTSFLFNTGRMAAGSKNSRRFVPFRVYYDAVNGAKLRGALIQAGVGLEFYSLLKDQQRHWVGIRQRDLAGIMQYSLLLMEKGKRPEDSLPSVARFALGLPEPQHSTLLSRTMKRKGSGKPHAPGRILAIETLMEEGGVRHGYLLFPGYRGMIPKNRLVFVPRSVAAGYKKLPKRVLLTGPAKVPWGRSPYAIANLPDLRHWTLKPLGRLQEEHARNVPPHAT